MQARARSDRAGADRTGGERLYGNRLSGDRLGEQLKCYFDDLTAGPTPDRLIKLTEALDAAFERGEFRCPSRRIG